MQWESGPQRLSPTPCSELQTTDLQQVRGNRSEMTSAPLTFSFVKKHRPSLGPGNTPKTPSSGLESLSLRTQKTPFLEGALRRPYPFSDSRFGTIARVGRSLRNPHQWNWPMRMTGVGDSLRPGTASPHGSLACLSS